MKYQMTEERKEEISASVSRALSGPYDPELIKKAVISIVIKIAEQEGKQGEIIGSKQQEFDIDPETAFLGRVLADYWKKR